MTKRRKKITTTVRKPKWQRNLETSWKGFVCQAKTALAAAGFVWLVILLMQWLKGG